MFLAFSEHNVENLCVNQVCKNSTDMFDVTNPDLLNKLELVANSHYTLAPSKSCIQHSMTQ